ncbi:MAG: bifunctional oligoribonuclease/PAP phosphatase NrnA [Deltaproteobacteria bacterium]|nr:MAG: bifunctional oligoribonuclease/PAP phosphatase NrnA [Deltaproteobacteria bacterium]
MTPAPPLSWSPPGLTNTIEHIARALRKLSHVLVVSHVRPDGDAIGSTLAATHALRMVGVRATAYNRDGVPPNLRFLPGAAQLTSHVPDEVDCILALDCAVAHRLGESVAALCREMPVFCLDHHVTVDEAFADILALDASAPACAELVYRLAVALGAPLDKALAIPLFAALHTDTGSFRYSSTRAETLEFGRILLTTGFDVWGICSELYESHPVERLRILPRVLDTLQLSTCGRFASLIVSSEVQQLAAGDESVLQGVINFARGVRGVEVATLLTEVNRGEYRVSFRSRGRVDVSLIAAVHGGGGHRNAASCVVQGELDHIIEQLQSAVARADAPGAS